MQELFEALKNFKPQEFKTNYYMVVKGREIECLAVTPGENHVQISKEDYLLLLKEGQQNFYFEQGKITLRPPVKNRRSYSILQKHDKGLIFQDSDPYWPIDIAEGGFIWQTPSE